MTPKTVSRTLARNAVLINQLVTPGLGSLIARRWVAGIGQILVALTGFGLVVCWFCVTMYQYYSLMTDSHTQPNTKNWIGILGAAVFIVAWLWAWVTSISLMREAKRANLAELQKPLA